jgi:predicted CopG family antitoxin
MTKTIRLARETRERLARLKTSRRETFDEVLKRLLGVVPERDDEGLYGQSFRTGLLDARLDIKEGRLFDHDRVKRRLGL